MSTAIAPPFYSALFDQVSRHPQAQATGKHWLEVVDGLDGVRAEERQWSGLDAFLESHANERLGKETLLGQIADSVIHVATVLKEDDPQPWRRPPPVPAAGVDGAVAHPFMSAGRPVDPTTTYGLRASELAKAYGVPTHDIAVWLQQVRSYLARESALAAVENAQAEIVLAQDLLRQDIDAFCADNGYDALSYPSFAQIAVMAPVLADWNGAEPLPAAIDLPDAEKAAVAAYASSTREAVKRLAEAFDIDERAQMTLSAMRGDSVLYSPLSLPYGENYRELLLLLPDQVTPDGPFISPHWDEPNVVAHVRLSDHRDLEGKRFLFVEEMQSDWHQIGRIAGYGDAGAVPDAPFKRTWYEMALRRVVRLAAEESYDGIALPAGEAVAARSGDANNTGLIAFYDRVLPAYAAKFGRQFGSNLATRTLEGNIPTGVLPMTPSLREHALARGFQQFSLGSDSDLTSLQPDPFSDWFAGSRVTDEAGYPRIMFHATDAQDFESFESSEDIGFHFGDAVAANALLSDARPGRNDGWSGIRIIPAYLSVRRPLDLPDLHSWGPDAVLDALSAAGLFDADKAGGERLVDRAFVQNLLEKGGYDAIRYRNEKEGGESFIVFDPRRIKSVFNIGSWLADDPRMSYSVTGANIGPAPSDRAFHDGSLRAFTIFSGAARRAMRQVYGATQATEAMTDEAVLAVAKALRNPGTVDISDHPAAAVVLETTLESLRSQFEQLSELRETALNGPVGPERIGSFNAVERLIAPLEDGLTVIERVAPSLAAESAAQDRGDRQHGPEPERDLQETARVGDRDRYDGRQPIPTWPHLRRGSPTWRKEGRRSATDNTETPTGGQDMARRRRSADSQGSVFDNRLWGDADYGQFGIPAPARSAGAAGAAAAMSLGASAAHADISDTLRSIRRMSNDLNATGRSIDRTVSRVGEVLPDVATARGTTAGSAPTTQHPAMPPAEPAPARQWPQPDNGALDSVPVPRKPPVNGPAADGIADLPSGTESVPNAVIGQEHVGQSAGTFARKMVAASGAELNGLRIPILSPDLVEKIELLGQIGLGAGIVLGGTATGGLLAAGAVAYKGYKAYRETLAAQTRSQPFAMSPRQFQTGASQVYRLERSQERTQSGRTVHRARLVDKSTGDVTFHIESEKALRPREVLAVYHAALVDEAERSLDIRPASDLQQELERERTRIDTARMIRSGAISPQTIHALADGLAAGRRPPEASIPAVTSALQIEAAKAIGAGRGEGPGTGLTVSRLSAALGSLTKPASPQQLGNNAKSVQRAGGVEI